MEQNTIKDHENNIANLQQQQQQPQTNIQLEQQNEDNQIDTIVKESKNVVKKTSSLEDSTSSPPASPSHRPVLTIAHILQQKYIYLTGSLDKSDHPILICAYNRTLGTLDQDDFKATIDYFKDISGVLWEEKKFIVIIDRQYGKWNSVKAMLQHLQTFKQGELFKILVLKPQGFLQRHFGNDTKQITELSHHDVIFLENPTMLEEYVDLLCLPDELGGYDNFNVNEWVEYTTAVERFQQTCNKIRSRVKEFKISFGNRVPLSSVGDIEHQSRQQQQMVNDIQEDIKCAAEIAETLAPIVDRPLSHSRSGPTALERYNSAQLKAYTERLTKYSAEIDKLWENQINFHEQSKELCSFEERFGQISIKLMQIASILEKRVVIGDSLQSAKELMMELDDFESKGKEPYDDMMKLKEKGLQMIAFFGAFAKESVIIRCNEIKNMLKDFETKLEARKKLLQISLDVFTCLDQIEKWCQVGVELLASQPMEDFNSSDGAKRCLQDIEQFMKSKSGINMKKIRKLNEMCQTLGNPVIDKRVAEALKKIEEVTEMLEKRETSLKKVAAKPKRPVQRVAAIVIDKDYDLNKDKVQSPKTPKTPMTPTVTTPNGGVTKESIEVVVTDDIEKFKRNKTFRKSLRLSFKRPVSSPAQLQLAEYEEDPENRKKIRQVISELVETEVVYAKDLKEIMEGYFALFDNPSFNVPEQFRNQKNVIFGNIEEIYIFHSDIFLEDLMQCKDAPYMAGQVFLDKKEEFQLYATYCKNKPKSESLRKELHKTTFLQAIQKQLGHPLNLDSYLLKPVQRVTKYKLLLTEMLKYVSKKNPAYTDILEALVCMKRVLRHVNDVMHSSGLLGFPKNLEGQGKLLLQDSFIVWEGKRNSLRQFTKLGGKQRQVFLFEKCLIFSKKEVENGRDLGTYQYKRHIWTADIGVTESVKGDVHKFEVWSKVVIFTVLAENVELKTNWLAEIRKILMSQFEGAKVTLNQKLSSSTIPSKLDETSKEHIRSKFKCLDPTLRGSTPALNITPRVPTDERHRYSTYDTPQKKQHLRTCTSETNLMSEDNRSTDSAWSDSEFEEEEEEEIYENQGTGSELPVSDHQQYGGRHDIPQILETTIDNEHMIDEEQAGVSPRTQEVIKFLAVADYTSAEDTELSFKQNDLITLIKEGDGGWWYCRHDVGGQEGWAPSGYLELNALDVTQGAVDNDTTLAEKNEPVRPSVPSPKRRLETAV